MGKYIVVLIMKLTVHMLRRHFVSIHSDGLTFPRSLSNLSTPIASHTVETTYSITKQEAAIDSVANMIIGGLAGHC